MRVKCDGCRHEHLAAFSCKCRGFRPSCGARRMVETSAQLIDHVLPAVPVRQWVLSFPWPLRWLFANRPEALTRVLAIVTRAIETSLIKRAEQSRQAGVRGGMVTLIQRFGSSLNLNVHLHLLVETACSRRRRVDNTFTPSRRRTRRRCRYCWRASWRAP